MEYESSLEAFNKLRCGLGDIVIARDFLEGEYYWNFVDDVLMFTSRGKSVKSGNSLNLDWGSCGYKGYACIFKASTNIS